MNSIRSAVFVALLIGAVACGPGESPDPIQETSDPADTTEVHQLSTSGDLAVGILVEAPPDPPPPPVDECNTTTGCQQLYPDAVDCVDSRSNQSFCACGSDAHRCAGAVPPTDPPVGPRGSFDPGLDLLSLHFDHAPDRDDGHSAAADRTLLESEFSCDFMARKTIAVAGTYGENASTYQSDSEAVMEAVFGPCGGWINAHADWSGAVTAVHATWMATLEAGGDIWVKEGGQSDLSAAVVRRIQSQSPQIDTRARIHVVQHSTWNENETTDVDLACVRQETDYLRIGDANAYLNVTGGDPAFEAAALSHPVFGASWAAAFDYYDPGQRIDYSDTGELMYILGTGELTLDEFRLRYLETATAGPRMIEIESTTVAGDWSLEATKAGYSGSGYFHWIGGDLFGSPGSGELSYAFTVPAAGDYEIEIRSRRDSEGVCAGAANDQCNDVFTRMDGGTWIKTLLKGQWGAWIWDTTLEPSSGVFEAPIYSLAPGVHILGISGRSRGMKIDAIRITRR